MHCGQRTAWTQYKHRSRVKQATALNRFCFFKLKLLYKSMGLFHLFNQRCVSKCMHTSFKHCWTIIKQQEPSTDHSQVNFYNFNCLNGSSNLDQAWKNKLVTPNCSKCIKVEDQGFFKDRCEPDSSFRISVTTHYNFSTHFLSDFLDKTADNSQLSKQAIFKTNT